MNKKTLRPYQADMIKNIYEKWGAGVKRLLAVAFTGWGKGLLVTTIAKQISSSHYVVLVVKTRKLVKQLSKELDEANVDHSVCMAGHNRLNPFHKIQVCSIDTLRARSEFPHIEHKNVVVIIDEAHMSTSATFQNFFAAYDQPLMLGVTATPFNLTLNNFDESIETIKPHELMEQGFLVPFTIYAPKLIETENIKVSQRTGDYNQKQLYVEASKRHIVGQFVENWIKFSQYRPTLLFAVNIEHSKQIAEQFMAVGIAARHIDADSTDKDREQAEADLKSGKLKIVTNVALWTTGVNIPEIACIQDCAPTKSENLFIQKWGRGTRVNDNWKNCVVIDNAGNVNDHGNPYALREISLPVARKSKKKNELVEKMQTCGECFRAFEPGPRKCPYCSSTREIKLPRISPIDKELSYLTDKDFEAIEKNKQLKKIAAQKEKFGNAIKKLNWQTYNFGWLKKKSPEDKEKYIWKHLIKQFGLIFCKLQSIYPLPDYIRKEHEFQARKINVLDLL